MPSALTLAVADSADSAAIANIWSSAFADDALDRAIYEGVTGPARRAWAAALAAAGARTDGVRLLKVTDEATDEIVAFAMWEVVEGEDGSRQGQRIGLPDGANQALSDAFQDALDVLRRKHMRGRRHYYLVLLATLPQHQRRGASRPLIRWGLDAAATEGVPAYVEASGTASCALYRSHGWVVVDELVLNLRSFGVVAAGEGDAEENVVKQWCMVKEPDEGEGEGVGLGNREKIL